MYNLVKFNGKYRLGIIADDLTGACDTGVQFAKQGFSTLVWLNLESLEDVPAELTVVTTNSRSNLSAEARQKVREVWTKLNLYFSPQLFGPQAVTSVV